MVIVVSKITLDYFYRTIYMHSISIFVGRVNKLAHRDLCYREYDVSYSDFFYDKKMLL